MPTTSRRQNLWPIHDEIRFKNHLAELYCRENPEKTEEFVRRVKELIGRYPEWYKTEEDTAR